MESLPTDSCSVPEQPLTHKPLGLQLSHFPLALISWISLGGHPHPEEQQLAALPGKQDAALPSVQGHGGTSLWRMLKQLEQNQIILVATLEKSAQVS